jgi:FkbM family methyltransferase
MSLSNREKRNILFIALGCTISAWWSSTIFQTIALTTPQQQQQSTSESLTLPSSSSSSSSRAKHRYKTKARMCPIKPEEEMKPLFHGQRSEDKHLLQWFQGLCGGTYLEMGALTGIRYSNTYAYHIAYNWSGVLVEPNPTSFKHLKKNRPHDINVHAAVCTDPRTLHWMSVPKNAPVSGIWEFSKPSFREKWWNGYTINMTTPIQCSPLTELLKEKAPNITFYDFFSLDIEGAELTALQSLDFNSVAFGIVLVEANEHFGLKNTAVRSLFENNGYIYLYDMLRSQWFAHRDFNYIYSDVIY